MTSQSSRPGNLRDVLLMFLSDVGRKRAIWIVFLALTATALELFGIAVVYPLILVIVNSGSEPATVAGSSGSWFSGISALLPASVEGMILLLLAAYMVRNGALVFVQFTQARINARAQESISRVLFAGYQRMPYPRFTQANQAELLRNLTSIIHGAYANGFAASVQLLADGIFAIGLIAVLLSYASLGMIATIVAAGALLVGQQLLFRRLFRRLGSQSNDLCAEEIEIVSQSLGAFKEVRILRRADMFYNRFRKLQARMRDNVAMFEFVRRLPPLIIESIVLVGFCGAALAVMGTSASGPEVVGVLAVFAFIGFRGIPVANRIVGSINTLENFTPALLILRHEREMAAGWQVGQLLGDRGTAGVTASVGHDASTISFRDVSYTHPASGRGIKNVDMTLRRGELTLVVGPSGAGKSTVIDLLLGLLPPDSGTISANGGGIGPVGYVPQSFYLFDMSIVHNVAFSFDTDEIDRERAREALIKAGLEDFSTEQGMAERVGGNGALLSGGQRQRLGLARALYIDPDCIVLDEPTSGLDAPTEESIFSTLSELALDRFVVIITHQRKLTKFARRVLTVRQGRLVEDV